MKKRLYLILMLLLLVITFTWGVGSCGGDTSNSFVELINTLPSNIDVAYYFDIQSLRVDDDLSEFHDTLRDELSWESEYEEQTGITFGDIEQMVFTWDIYGTFLCVIQGSFNMNEVHDTLEAMTNDKGEFAGIEVWVGKYSYRNALLDDKFFFGDVDRVEDYISTIQSQGESFYDNEFIKATVDRLPDGLWVVIGNKELLMEVEAWGMGVSKSGQSSEMLEVSGYNLYASASIAEDVLSELQDEMEYVFETGSIDCRLDGSFVEFVGEVDIAEFIYLEIWYPYPFF